MRNIEEFSTFWSAAEHQRSALSLKRLAGGVATQIEQAGVYDLSGKEIMLLESAQQLLYKMATLRTKAKVVKDNEQIKSAEREKEAVSLTKSNFGALESNEDKIAFVASVSHYAIAKLIENPDQQSIDQYFQESVETLVYRLSNNKGDLKAAVAEIWDKFQSIKIEKRAVVCQVIAASLKSRVLN